MCGSKCVECCQSFAAGIVWVWRLLKAYFFICIAGCCAFCQWLCCPSRGYRVCKTVRHCYVKKRPDTNLGGADVALWDKVKKEMAWQHNSNLDILEVEEMPEDQFAVTFILCPVTSRVASNVEHALKGITSQKNMVLLLFHSIAPHISNTPNTKDTLGSQYQDLGDIVDVVIWLTGSGGVLRVCPENNRAVRQICNAIQMQIY